MVQGVTTTLHHVVFRRGQMNKMQDHIEAKPIAGLPLKKRIAGIDLLRIFATFAVVCIHATQPGQLGSTSPAWINWIQICGFAVPCFFLIAGYFCMQSWTRSGMSRESVLKYLKRLLLLFLFWGGFYTVVPPFIGEAGSPSGVSAIQLAGERISQTLHHPKFFIFHGNAYHLWFLSSLIQAAALAYIGLRFASMRIVLLVGFVLYGFALTSLTYGDTPLGLRCTFDMKSGPFVSTLFFAIGAWLKQHNRLANPRIGAILLIAGLVIQHGERTISTDAANSAYLLGTIPYSLGVFLIALTVPISVNSRLLTLASYSLGIYVLHAYLIELFLRAPSHLIQYPPQKFAMAIFTISAVMVLLLSRWPVLRPLLM